MEEEAVVVVEVTVDQPEIQQAGERYQIRRIHNKGHMSVGYEPIADREQHCNPSRLYVLRELHASLEERVV